MEGRGMSGGLLEPAAADDAPGSPEIITLRAPSPQAQHRLGPRSPQIPKAPPSRKSSVTTESELAREAPPPIDTSVATARSNAGSHVFTGPLPPEFLRCWSNESEDDEDEEEDYDQSAIKQRRLGHHSNRARADADRAILEVFVAEGRMDRPHGIVMSLSLRMALGRKERVTEVQGGMSPKWLERVGFVIRKPYPPTMDIYLDDIGLFRESTIARATMHMAPIYETGPKRCVVTLVNEWGSREATTMDGHEIRPMATESSLDVSQPGDTGNQSSAAAHRPVAVADSDVPYPMPPAQNGRNVALRDEVAIEQISGMFPGYDQDILYEMFVACDGDTERVVDALLAMEQGDSQ